MRTTVFSTPLLTPMLRFVALGVLKIVGWKAIGTELKNPRFVLIGAPHTSNWDFVLMLLVILKLRLQVYWMGKHTLFSFPFGGFMKWLGGISVNRNQPYNVVRDIVRQYKNNESLIVIISPKGTRKKVEKWKTGFYHIATNANVPILLGYVDASRKEAGIADLFHSSGELEKDMAEIQNFYADKKGINPENA
tara:strand:+ start:447 stop:1022 length:576 start_codon:yes stop_codon:yes gene_type:complete